MTINGLDEAHVQYLDEHSLGTLATVSASGWPQAKPVMFRYDPALGTVDISGQTMQDSAKFRNVAINPRVAFTVDDVPDPSAGAAGVRFVEIRGFATQVELEVPFVSGLSPWIIRIAPRRLVSYNVAAPGFYSADIA